MGVKQLQAPGGGVCRAEGDGEDALVVFLECGTGGFVVLMLGVGPEDGGGAVAEDGGALEDAGGEDHAGAAVVQSDGEGEDAPGEGLAGIVGLEEEAAAGAVDVGLAGLATERRMSCQSREGGESRRRGCARGTTRGDGRGIRPAASLQ
jgi:hypothetical protein